MFHFSKFKICLCFFLLVSSSLLFSDQEVLDKSGNPIVLKTNGTWSYVQLPEYENAFTFRPFGMLGESILASALRKSLNFELGIEYQRVIDHYWVVSIYPDFLYRSYIYSNAPALETSFSIQAGISLHPFGKGLRGFYFGLFPELFVQSSQDIEYNLIGIYILGMGAELGYQWVSRNGFVLSLGCGVNAFPRLGFYPLVLSENMFSYTPISFRLNVSLGFAIKDK